MSAIAGIDQALWDIKGKALGQPIHSLLGGQVRDKIKVYSWIGGDRPADVANNARDVVARGFKAIKLNGCEEMQIVDSYDKVEKAVETIATIREAIGPYIGIGVDFHGRVHRPMAKVLAKELEPYKLMFIEEPVLSRKQRSAEGNRQSLARRRSRSANGSTRAGTSSQVLSDGYVDIIQPDLSHAGGITECRKIAAMAEAYDVALAPHCPLGPIALAACLQVDAVSYNAFIQEQSLGIHYNKGNDILDYISNKEVFQYADGFVTIPQGPGLGIEVDEAYVIERAKEGHRWRNPIWRHEDGSVAEW